METRNKKKQADKVSFTAVSQVLVNFADFIEKIEDAKKECDCDVKEELIKKLQEKETNLKEANELLLRIEKECPCLKVQELIPLE